MSIIDRSIQWVDHPAPGIPFIRLTGFFCKNFVVWKIAPYTGDDFLFAQKINLCYGIDVTLVFNSGNPVGMIFLDLACYLSGFNCNLRGFGHSIQPPPAMQSSR